MLLRRACVDQGTIILYPEDSEEQRQVGTDGNTGSGGSGAGSGGSGAPSPLPFLIQPAEHQSKWDGAFNPPPIRVRAAASGTDAAAGTDERPQGREGAAYLRRPTFANCTVPVIWYSMW